LSGLFIVQAAVKPAPRITGLARSLVCKGVATACLPRRSGGETIAGLRASVPGWPD
jgi:hypothetical protein